MSKESKYFYIGLNVGMIIGTSAFFIANLIVSIN